MIVPGGIPQFTGDFEQLERDVTGLRKNAVGIRNNGSDIHSRFQMMEAFYVAPEADDLFATTRPVMDRAETFATKLETVADALDTYATEGAPLAKRLAELQEDAKAFAASVEGDDDWTEDEDKVRRNEELIDEVTATHLAFQEAERRAANKISALVGGPQFVADHGSGFHRRDTVTYGVDKKLLEGAEDLPWGSVDEQSYETWSAGWFGHGIKSALWDGVYKDGIEAGVVGLWTLAGGNGGEAAGDAWGGLLDAVRGIGLYTMKPYDALMDSVFGPDKESAEEVEAKKAAREFGKGILAWDQWEENPARAAGTVTFNLLTLGAGPLMKAGMAGEAGAWAKGAGALGRAGLYLDPIAVTAMATGKVAGRIPTLSELTARLTAGSAAAADAQRLHSVIELDDGSRVLVDNGEFIAYDRHGRVVNEAAPPERSASGTDHSAPADVRQREPAGVGGASRGTGGVHAGDNSQSVGGGTGATAATHGVAPDASSARAGGVHGSDASPVASDRTSGGPGVADRPDGGVSETVQRPSFMRDGENPYGPPGALTAEQIKEIQVYRANHEPGYRETYYRDNGRRLRIEVSDESGFSPPQLVRDPRNPSVWIAATDAPPAFPPKYIPGSETVRGADTVLGSEAERVLAEAAQQRHVSIAADTPWHSRIVAATEHHARVRTPESLAALEELKAQHAPIHEQMGRDAEAFGEAVARHHVIPEHYQGATWEKLDGPKNGNDQFDQLWRRKDGGFVVIEAKSSGGTKLNERTLPNGFKAAQGSREYFLDILNEMRKRGDAGNGREAGLYKELKRALKQGKVDYVLVKGKVNGGEYAGYSMRRFDLG